MGRTSNQIPNPWTDLLPPANDLHPVNSKQEEINRLKREESEKNTFDEAFGRALRAELLKQQLAGDLRPYIRKRKENELRNINNWFTSPQKRKALQWQKPLHKIALDIQRRANKIIPLSTLLKHEEVAAILSVYEISEKTARQYLSRNSFGLRVRGRPRKTLR